MSDDFALTHPVPVGGRASHDHWPTPRWCTEALVRHVGLDLAGRPALDPACGEGCILDVLREHGARTLGLELDPVRAEAARQRGHLLGFGNALERRWPDAALLVMNPPYSLADAFVQKALEWRHETGHYPPVWVLLRLSYLEPTAARRTMLGAYTPDVLILPRRPMFDGRGHDNITSAWFGWPGQGRHEWLPEVST